MLAVMRSLELELVHGSEAEKPSPKSVSFQLFYVGNLIQFIPGDLERLFRCG